MRKTIVVAAAALLVAGIQQIDVLDAEDRVDRNLRVMIEAARKLEFTGAANGRAYLLVKHESFGSGRFRCAGRSRTSLSTFHVDKAVQNASHHPSQRCDYTSFIALPKMRAEKHNLLKQKAFLRNVN